MLTLVAVSVATSCRAPRVGARDAPTRPAVASAPSTLVGRVTMTIGGARDTRPAYTFGAVRGLALDTGGRVFVADDAGQTVRVYSARGEYERAIGDTAGVMTGATSGATAGWSPSGLAFDAAGRLWLRDLRRNRFEMWDVAPRAGVLLRAFPASWVDFDPFDRVTWDDAGRVIERRLAPRVSGRTWTSIRVSLDSNGSVVASDTSPTAPEDSLIVWRIPDASGFEFRINSEFAAERLEAFGGRGMAAYAMSSNYAVSLVDARGKRVALLQRAVRALPVSTEERERVAAWMRDVAKQRRHALTDAEIAAVTPTVKPVIAGLWFDADGRLWVSRTVAPSAAMREADVYDATGAWVAVLQWPRAVELAWGAVRGRVGVGVVRGAGGGARVVGVGW